jgi:hypothetical protein
VLHAGNLGVVLAGADRQFYADRELIRRKLLERGIVGEGARLVSYLDGWLIQSYEEYLAKRAYDTRELVGADVFMVTGVPADA